MNPPKIYIIYGNRGRDYYRGDCRTKKANPYIGQTESNGENEIKIENKYILGWFQPTHLERISFNNSYFSKFDLKIYLKTVRIRKSSHKKLHSFQ